MTTATTTLRGSRYNGRPAHDDGIIDEIAVERAAAGDRTVWLTHAERAAAIALLRERGHSLRDISQRIGLAERNVSRYIAALTHPTGVAS